MMNKWIVGILLTLPVLAAGNQKPNVLLIVCDDLNDYVETFGGHPQTQTPNIKRLIDSGVSFKQAHCTIPICAPSRASFLTGIYPHHSGFYGFDDWTKNPVLRNSRTMMQHFRAHGYLALGTGKVMHNQGRQEWNDFGHPSDYGPFAFNGEKDVPHPDTPAPFRDDFGIIDGSFGPLINLDGRNEPDSGKAYSWRTGGWNKKRDMAYRSDADRDPTGDELNAQWAADKLQAFAKDPGSKPFFMGVGFLRPHTPLIVPQKYFDRFPLDRIQLPVIKENDADDTFKHTVTSTEDDRSSDRGAKIYDSLIASYDGDRELALKKFIQAYLASVASIDDLIGQLLDVVDATALRKNTIVVFTSDHGWGMGQKDYLYKNSLWQESTRIPLVIRAPGESRAGHSTDLPVSLIDLYPTLIDLCDLPNDTVTNDQGRPLDGHSMRPLLTNDTWDGPDAALTAMYKWARSYDPKHQSYSLRSKDWRYIRYENGKEELYHTSRDAHEWLNLADSPEHTAVKKKMNQQLSDHLATSVAPTPPPATQKANRKSTSPKSDDGEAWKDTFFNWHPKADANKDGTLSWAEYKTYKAALDAKKK